MSGVTRDPELRPVAQRYLSALLDGDEEGARSLLADALRHGSPSPAVYQDVVSRAMDDVGRLWALHELTVAGEHMASEITAAAIARTRAPATAGPGAPTAVIACLAPEAHAIGAQTVAAVLSETGWRTLTLGASVPKADLVRFAGEVRPRLVALSVKSASHADPAVQAAQELKDAAPGVLVLLGGAGVAHLTDVPPDGVDLVTDDLAHAARWAGER